MIDEAHDGRITFLYLILSADINALLITTDNLYIVTASSDMSIKIWSLIERKCIYTFLNAHRSNLIEIIVIIQEKSQLWALLTIISIFSVQEMTTIK